MGVPASSLAPPRQFQPRLIVSKLLASITFSFVCATASFAADAYKWSVQYIVDNSIQVMGRPQKKWPRNNRGLALSPDGKTLYIGYLHSWNNQGEIRRVVVDVEDYEEATVAVLQGPLPKAIATDDKGRVYIADPQGILIYDADLEQFEHKIHVTSCEGVATVREGGKLLLFASERGSGEIHRWVLKEDGDKVVGAEANGFDGTGVFKVPGALSLRGLDVDASGNIWVCDYDANKVFRIRKDGKDLASVEVKTPIDLGFDGKRVFVTRGLARTITVLDDSLVVVGNLDVPWEELELSYYGNNRHGSIAGIATVPGKGFYVANEAGQTAGQRSIYGKADDDADIVEGKVYRDSHGDDNDPILKATAVVAQGQ